MSANPKLVVTPRVRTLEGAPVGLLLFNDQLIMKTEYRTKQGAIEAYIVSSGEFFWGDAPQTVQSQLRQRVQVVDVAY